MAVVGIHCEWCDTTFPVQIVGVTVKELTKRDIRRAVELFTESHGKVHLEEVFQEVEEVLTRDGHSEDS